MRKTLRRTIVAAAAVAIAAGTVLAYEKPILRGVSSEYGPTFVKKLVIKKDFENDPRPPGGQIPGEPTRPKDPMPLGVRDGAVRPGGIGGGGAVVLASATPQVKLEHRLKDLARDLR